MTEYIDIEPTWEALCHLAQKGALPPEQLMPACKTADMVRQAQKSGAQSITFSFPDRNGDALVEIKE